MTPLRKLLQKYGITGTIRKAKMESEWTHIISVSCGNGADFEKFLNEDIFQDAKYFPQEGKFGVRIE